MKGLLGDGGNCRLGSCATGEKRPYSLRKRGRFLEDRRTSRHTGANNAGAHLNHAIDGELQSSRKKRQHSPRELHPYTPPGKVDIIGP